jgi:hypothetical protein
MLEQPSYTTSNVKWGAMKKARYHGMSPRRRFRTKVQSTAEQVEDERLETDLVKILRRYFYLDSCR